MSSEAKRVLIVGGVAGGASCAARLRRIDEFAEIHIFDRGDFVSFANCGLPYHIGDVIPKEDDLLVATPALFEMRFNIRVHTRHEAVRINREEKTLVVRKEFVEPYTHLLLAPGASPIRPPLAGLSLPGVFCIRTIPDAHYIKQWIVEHRASRAVVIGGGFVGLEMAENLRHRDMHVTVVEMLDHVLPPLDKDLASVVSNAMADAGVDVVLGDGLKAVEQRGDGDADAAEENPLVVVTSSGRRLPCGVVVLSIGVQPESGLARAAGLDLGGRGTIKVDAHMRTSDPNIYAVGDAVETTFTVTGQPMHLALAGPANRQGRVAAEAMCGRARAFRGVQGTAVCGLFGLTVAMTGATEGALQRSGHDMTHVQAVHCHPGHHVSYYPGAHAIHIKLVFDARDGRVLGMQAVGNEGVEKRVDVVSMAMQLNGTVQDLMEAELCYAPQFGAAKDPVNIAGMIASNVVAGDVVLSDWDKVVYHERAAADGVDPGVVLDVREPCEYKHAEPLPGSILVPMCDVRGVFEDKLPKDRVIHVLCKEGQRAYNIARALRQRGYDARFLSGGMTTYLMHVGKPVPKYRTPIPGMHSTC